MRRKPISIVLFFLLFGGLLLFGCSIQSGKQNFWPTETATLTLTPTCPPVTINTPAPFERKPNLYVFIYDADAENSIYVNEEIQDIFDVLKIVYQPGDRYFIFRSGFRTWNESYVLSNTTGGFEYPNLAPTPTMQEMTFPTDQKVPSDASSLEKIKINQNNGTAMASANQSATQTYRQFGCAQAAWSSVYGTQSAVWEKTKTANIDSSIQYLQENFFAEATKLAEISTPVPIYFESLDFASSVFAHECGDYGNCKLVIMSDMRNWAGSDPSKYGIDFTNVRVMVVMKQCNPIYESGPECSEREEILEKEFQSFNNVSSSDEESVIFTNLSNGVEELVDFLK